MRCVHAKITVLLLSVGVGRSFLVITGWDGCCALCVTALVNSETLLLILVFIWSSIFHSFFYYCWFMYPSCSLLLFTDLLSFNLLLFFPSFHCSYCCISLCQTCLLVCYLLLPFHLNKFFIDITVFVTTSVNFQPIWLWIQDTAVKEVNDRLVFRE